MSKDKYKKASNKSTNGAARKRIYDRCTLEGTISYLHDEGHNDYGSYRGIKLELDEADLKTYEEATDQYVGGEHSEKARDAFVSWEEAEGGDDEFFITIFEKGEKGQFAPRTVGDRVAVEGYMKFVPTLVTSEKTGKEVKSDTEKTARFTADSVTAV